MHPQRRTCLTHAIDSFCFCSKCYPQFGALFQWQVLEAQRYSFFSASRLSRFPRLLEQLYFENNKTLRFYRLNEMGLFVVRSVSCVPTVCPFVNDKLLSNCD